VAERCRHRDDERICHESHHQKLTVLKAGVHSPELKSGDTAELTVQIKSAVEPEVDVSIFTNWRQFAGVWKGDCGSSAKDSIDADLTKEYGSPHESEQ
jgi:hypothetical protein